MTTGDDDAVPGHEVVATQQRFAGAIFSVDTQTIRDPDGSTNDVDVVRHSASVAVVPRGDDGRIHLLRQYRPAVQAELLEIPAGLVDDGEEPLDAARRELQEETGLTAERWTLLLTLRTTPGMTDEAAYVYLAEGLDQGEANTEPSEHVRRTALPLAELVDLIRAQQVTNALTVAGALAVAAGEGRLGVQAGVSPAA